MMVVEMDKLINIMLITVHPISHFCCLDIERFAKLRKQILTGNETSPGCERLKHLGQQHLRTTLPAQVVRVWVLLHEEWVFYMAERLRESFD